LTNEKVIRGNMLIVVCVRKSIKDVFGFLYLHILQEM